MYQYYTHTPLKWTEIRERCKTTHTEGNTHPVLCVCVCVWYPFDRSHNGSIDELSDAGDCVKHADLLRVKTKSRMTAHTYNTHLDSFDFNRKRRLKINRVWASQRKLRPADMLPEWKRYTDQIRDVSGRKFHHAGSRQKNKKGDWRLHRVRKSCERRVLLETTIYFTTKMFGKKTPQLYHV